MWWCSPFTGITTKLSACAALVDVAEHGYYVEERDNLLHVGTKDVLRKLVSDGHLCREKLAGQLLYCAATRSSRLPRRRAQTRSSHISPRCASASPPAGFRSSASTRKRACVLKSFHSPMILLELACEYWCWFWPLSVTAEQLPALLRCSKCHAKAESTSSTRDRVGIGIRDASLITASVAEVVFRNHWSIARTFSLMVARDELRRLLL
jgi:hypothetical protein